MAEAVRENFDLGLDGSWTDSSNDEAAAEGRRSYVYTSVKERVTSEEAFATFPVSRGKEKRKGKSVTDENRWNYISEPKAQSLYTKCVLKNTATNT
jgi:hypothetical protein